MSSLNLGSSIIKSLRLGHMDPDMPLALLDATKTKARHRSEGRYWDYKERLPLDTKFAISEFAKDVLAFHNTEGGVIIVSISNQYIVRGIPC